MTIPHIYRGLIPHSFRRIQLNYNLKTKTDYHLLIGPVIPTVSSQIDAFTNHKPTAGRSLFLYHVLLSHSSSVAAYIYHHTTKYYKYVRPLVLVENWRYGKEEFCR